VFECGTKKNSAIFFFLKMYEITCHELIWANIASGRKWENKRRHVLKSKKNQSNSENKNSEAVREINEVYNLHG
jgi:hypothetical protein